MATLIGDLVTRVQQRADRVDASYRGRALDALDEAVQYVAMTIPWDALRKTEVFLTNGTPLLVLPDRVARVESIFDASALRQLDAGDHWESRAPGAYGQQTPGSPLEWRPRGMEPVLFQPATDTTLTFSTTVSDGMNVVVRGLCRDTGASGTALEKYEVTETVLLGAAGGAFTTVNYFAQVLALQKDKNTLSDVLVRFTNTGERVSRIPSWETRPLLPRIELLFSPPAGTRLGVTYFRRPERLVSEADVLDPALDEEALIWRAVGNLHWAQNEGQAAQVAWQKSAELMAARRNQEQTHGEGFHSVNPAFGYFQHEGLPGEDRY